jgi:hypothetical protein
MVRFSPFRLGPFVRSGNRVTKSMRSDASVLFRDSAGDSAISFHLKGVLGGSKGNKYRLMFSKIAPGPRWSIRIYDPACNIYLSITLTLATAMSGLPAAIAGGGLAGVLEARVYKSVDQDFTDANCGASIRFSGGV